MTTYTTLARTLDEDSWEWLLREHPTVAVAVEAEVKAGADPDALGRWMAQHIGDHRQGMISRCVGAARYVKGQG